MNPKILALCSAVAISLLLTPSDAAAWGGQQTGTIERIVATSNGFYIRLSGSPALCATVGTENGTSTGFSVAGTHRGLSADAVSRFLSVAVAAKLSGKPVTLSSDNSSEWGCDLREVALTE